MATSEEREDIHKRVDFELVLRRLQGNHFHYTDLSFKGCQLTHRPEWIKQLCEALSENNTLAVLDLSESSLNDAALQQLAISLSVPTRCPKLTKLDLRGNPDLTVAGETMAQGLCRLRTNFEVILGEGFDQAATSFGCDKELVEGLTTWSADELQVPGGGQQDFFCPKEISGDGEQIQMTRGFQGTNGTKYSCEMAELRLSHDTGNFILVKLFGKAAPGVVV